MNRANLFRTLSIAGLAALSAAPQNAAEIRRLTLTEAVRLAISQNRTLKIAHLKVIENQQKKAGERSAYFPSITNQSSALHITDLQNIVIPTGGLGTVGGSFVPTQSVTLAQVQRSLYSSGTMLSQPLTQLIGFAKRTGSRPLR